MSKRKLPPSLVVAFATLALLGVMANGGQNLRGLGFNAAPKQPLTASPMTPAEVAQQREEMMQKMQPGRRVAARDLNMDAPLLLVEAEAGNVRQTPNISQPVTMWWAEESYTKKVKDDFEVERGLVKQTPQICGTTEPWWNEDSSINKLKKKEEAKKSASPVTH